jgi:hypothetical protein
MKLLIACACVFVWGFVCGMVFDNQPVAKPVHIVRVYQA